MLQINKLIYRPAASHSASLRGPCHHPAPPHSALLRGTRLLSQKKAQKRGALPRRDTLLLCVLSAQERGGGEAAGWQAARLVPSLVASLPCETPVVYSAPYATDTPDG